MNRLLLGVLALVLLSGCVAAPDTSDARTRAYSAYTAGDVAAAAVLWEVVAVSEPAAVDARINAAQSYLQADDVGRALLWFRRAQALDPRPSAVQVGIALVRALRVDILGDEAGLLPALERFTVEIVSLSELAWITALVWSAAFICAVVMLWRPRVKRAAVLLAGGAVLLLVLLVSRDLSQRMTPSAVITAFETLLMSEPGTAGVALSRLYSAAEVRVVEARAGWLLVTLPDGRAGWLPESDVMLVRED